MLDAVTRRMALAVTGVVTLITLAASAQAGGGAVPSITFEKDVRPILKTYCFHCHGEEAELKGDLDVRLKRLLEKGGEHGAAITPGSPEKSRLVQMIRAGKMPKTEKKVKPEQLAVIEQWIAAGAPTLRPEPEKLAHGNQLTQEDQTWWAFQPIARPTPPQVKAANRVSNPIDAFLLAKLEAKGLSFNPEADRRTLIRRAYFDLIGLPPTPAEVDAFVNDRSPDAWEKVIDQALASPHYGEVWGRHWLDVAGYADSEGYNDDDTVRDDAWRYRDYVIRSVNQDKPWDQFITEQLAGDELIRQPITTLTADEADKLIATGYLRMAPDGTGTNNADPELAKQAVLTETVKIVSTSLLGMTVGCAECHDHRFDPILQKDFYRLRAIFEPTLNPEAWKAPKTRQVSMLTPEQVKISGQLEVEARKVEAKMQERFEELADWVFEQEVAALPEAIREKAAEAGRVWRKDPKKLTPEQKKLTEDYPGVKVSGNYGFLNLFLEKYGKGKETKDFMEKVKAEAEAIRAKKPEDRRIRAAVEPIGVAVPKTFVFARGDYHNKKDEVAPGDLTVLSPDKPSDFTAKPDAKLKSTGRRLAFARELTSGSHPLLTRVLVNRFWMHHFGRGIVATPGDFGRQGDLPTHPELLDWLATEFVREGWSLKRFHKLIMTSTAYRQSSARHAAGDKVDVGNALYWRMPVRRLQAETLRDAILAVSGKLNVQMFGSPIPVTPDANSQMIVGGEKPSPDGQEFRRSVYVQQRRTAPANVLATFDEPQMEPNCDARNCSTVAPQSLLLMNSQFIVDQSTAMAKRVQREGGKDLRSQLTYLWRLTFGQEPSARNLDDMTAYIGRQAKAIKSMPKIQGKLALREDPEGKALASLCQILAGSNPFLYVD